MLGKRLGRIATLLAEVVVEFLSAFLCVSVYLKAEDSLLLRTEDCKKSVRSYAVK